MVRPRKRRRIQFEPRATFYKPAGIPMRNLKMANLKHDEIEAMRLKNVKELKNEEAAEKMDVSRSTFQRILNLAYKKLTLALVQGKAIRIEEG